jgi:hypothetical protein
MDPNVRTGLLAMGLVFCVVFFFLTLAVVAESSFDILTVVSLLIIGMVVLGLVGAMRNPPD